MTDNKDLGFDPSGAWSKLDPDVQRDLRNQVGFETRKDDQYVTPEHTTKPAKEGPITRVWRAITGNQRRTGEEQMNISAKVNLAKHTIYEQNRHEDPIIKGAAEVTEEGGREYQKFVDKYDSTTSQRYQKPVDRSEEVTPGRARVAEHAISGSVVLEQFNRQQAEANSPKRTAVDARESAKNQAEADKFTQRAEKFSPNPFARTENMPKEPTGE
jgi:hypothetical protein